jgi:oligopeptide/dipeptide ABC transporter ATP-binding protein
MTPVLAVEALAKHFPTPRRGQVVHAVNDVSFAIGAGETVGMVGESGSGKSTIGRLILRLIAPTAGRILFEGRDIAALSERQMRPLRAAIQIVFQDPWAALNPRLRARDLIEEPLLLHTPLDRAERRARAEALAERVHLSRAMLDRFPAELSGGQLQRVCIARAIATNPRLIVLDEPTSSLDLSVRAGILDLLHELRTETGAAMLFITHDLGTVRLISDRVLVLYLGRVVEEAPTATIFDRAAHPYTQALLSAHLPADPAAPLRRHVLEGEIPSPIGLPPGCGFASRCPVAAARCRTDAPALEALGPAHRAACLRIAEGANRLDAAPPL